MPDVSTVHSPWHLAEKPKHWYGASTRFVKDRLLGTGSCLVIGSPLFEAIWLEKHGWDVTYLDVRKPPYEFKRYVEGDATKLPFEDDSFDAVSSACVLTHAGLGRYGDAIVPDGDEVMLAEIARVMKPNAPAALTFGGVITADLPLRVGNMHRIYTIQEAERMCLAVGLKVEEVRVWSTNGVCWVEKPTADEKNFDYLSVLVRNVAAA